MACAGSGARCRFAGCREECRRACGGRERRLKTTRSRHAGCNATALGGGAGDRHSPSHDVHTISASTRSHPRRLPRLQVAGPKQTRAHTATHSPGAPQLHSAAACSYFNAARSAETGPAGLAQPSRRRAAASGGAGTWRRQPENVACTQQHPGHSQQPLHPHRRRHRGAVRSHGKTPPLPLPAPSRRQRRRREGCVCGGWMLRLPVHGSAQWLKQPPTLPFTNAVPDPAPLRPATFAACLCPALPSSLHPPLLCPRSRCRT